MTSTQSQNQKLSKESLEVIERHIKEKHLLQLYYLANLTAAKNFGDKDYEIKQTGGFVVQNITTFANENVTRYLEKEYPKLPLIYRKKFVIDAKVSGLIDKDVPNKEWNTLIKNELEKVETKYTLGKKNNKDNQADFFSPARKTDNLINSSNIIKAIEEKDYIKQSDSVYLDVEKINEKEERKSQLVKKIGRNMKKNKI
jgi:hypothetical protein